MITNYIYTGIGSRKTPKEILNVIKSIAYSLSKKGYTLRSGAAPGADTAFEIGHCKWMENINGNKGKAEIFLPWNKFEKRKISETSILAEKKCNVKYITINNELLEKCWKIVRDIHPAWNLCTIGAKKLHGRNVLQILGEDLESPSDFVVCWTPNAQLIGGTATAIKIAQERNIPVYNLASRIGMKKVEEIAELQLLDI